MFQIGIVNNHFFILEYADEHFHQLFRSGFHYESPQDALNDLYDSELPHGYTIHIL